MPPLRANNEDRNADAIEALRVYCLQRIDALETMIGQGVSQEELSPALAKMHEDITDVKEELKVKITGVTSDLKDLIGRINQVEENVLEKQQESYRRIIGIQALVLGSIVTTLIGLAIPLIFKH